MAQSIPIGSINVRPLPCSKQAAVPSESMFGELSVYNLSRFSPDVTKNTPDQKRRLCCFSGLVVPSCGQTLDHPWGEGPVWTSGRQDSPPGCAQRTLS